MNDTLHDIGNLSDNQYTLERTPDGPALRLHIKGERTSAYILVEPGVEPGNTCAWICRNKTGGYCGAG